MADGDTIIIRGGSTEVEFDPDIFRPESDKLEADQPTADQPASDKPEFEKPKPDKPGRKKFKNDKRKITSIQITGGGINFNTGDHPEGLNCVITVHTA